MNTSITLVYKCIAVFFCTIFIGSFGAASVWASDVAHAFTQTQKHVVVEDDGLRFDVELNAETIAQALDTLKISIGAHDSIFPDKNEKLFPGMKLVIQRGKKITVSDGTVKKEFYTTQKRIEDAIFSQKELHMGEDDFTSPARSVLVKDGMNVIITHVRITEQTVDEKIQYKTITNEDKDLSWREKKVTQKGEYGTNRITYRITEYNGKEISRKVLTKEKTKDPVDEVVTQGTFVKVGKTHTGVASWYAYTGTLAAANPWLPMGSYVRVTNVENGKSVIVKINDRGPFGNGRIIDLDKVAFAQIASLGAGVANIKMEVITN